MSRSAWVIHMSAVTLAQMTRNAPSVVRRIYRPMDPIDLRVPARDEASVRRTPYARRSAPMLIEALFTSYLIRQQSGLAKAKPLTMHNKTLIGAVCLSAATGGCWDRVVDGPEDPFWDKWSGTRF